MGRILSGAGRPRARVRGWPATLLGPALIAAACHAQAGQYHLGQGYTAGALNVAGYANVLAGAPRGEAARLTLDDLSLFVTGRVNRYVHPFFEAELTEGAIWREAGAWFGAPRPRLVLERLYNDSELGGGFSVRLGKMLTPVGEWNTIHAAPLVATINQPMTTYRGFNEYTSGVALNYDVADGDAPELQLYWQPRGELLPKPRALVTRRYDDAAGVHASWSTGLNDKVGVSLQRAHVAGVDEAQTLLGLNLRKTREPFELEAEAIYVHLGGANPARVRGHEWGAYALGAYAPTGQLSLMLRHERFADRASARVSANTLLGLSYRPDAARVWKLEYIRAGGAALDVKTGLAASFAVLF